MSNHDRIHSHATRVQRGFGPREARGTAGLVLGALFLLGAPRAEAAFGVSPPWVKHDALLVGTTFFQTVDYSTNEPVDGTLFTYALQNCDTELASWMTISLPTGPELRPGELGPWPPGEQHLPTVVRVAAPANAALGARHCDLMAKFCPPGVDGGVSICLGARVPVDVVLTDLSLVAYRTTAVRMPEYYVKLGAPVHIELEVENTGNVDVTSLPVEVKVWPHKLGTPYAGPYTAEATNRVLSNPIPAYQVSPRAKRQITFPFPSLPIGIYYLGVTADNSDGADYQNSLYLEIYSCPPCRGLTQGTGTQCHVLPELEGTSCPGGTCVQGVCNAPDGGVPDTAPDAGMGGQDGKDATPADVWRDAANLVDGGRVIMDVRAIDNGRADTPLGSGSTDARSDAASLPDGAPDLAPDLAASDLLNADRPTVGLPDAAFADTAIGAVQVDAVPVQTFDATSSASVDASVGTVDAGATFPNSTAPDVGGASVDSGHGSAASGKGCSCRLGGGGNRESASTWLLLVGLLALSRLALRHRKPRA